MNKIKILSDRIIIDGHADTKEQCETATMLANLLSAQGSGFDCVEYRSGYAEFKKSDVVKLADSELKFPPAAWTITFVWDGNIESVVLSNSSESHTYTASGSSFTLSYGTTYTITVNCASGYVLDTISGVDYTDKTNNSFIIDATGKLGEQSTITLTSRSAAVKNYIISGSELTAIADAARVKSNITTKLTPAQIAEKINNLTVVANIDTADKMATLLVAENEGNVYKYVGTTTADYINGDLYIVKTASTGETWVLNARPYGTSRSLGSITASINFTSNNTNYSRIFIPIEDDLSDGTEALLYDDQQAYRNLEWYNQAYRTLTFAIPPTGDLLTWLQANGIKQ